VIERPSPRASDRFRLIDRGKDFRAPPFPLLSEGKRFLHGVFLALKASALDSLTG
jgi:hypothetical protein